MVRVFIADALGSVIAEKTADQMECHLQESSFFIGITPIVSRQAIVVGMYLSNNGFFLCFKRCHCNHRLQSHRQSLV